MLSLPQPGPLRSLPHGTRLLVSVVLFVLVCGAMSMAPSAEEPSGAAIEIDMLVSQGGVVELYLNGERGAPLRVPVVAGQRHTYRFERVPEHLTFVRLDPTAVASAHIDLYGITCSANGRTITRFSASDLQAWRFTNVRADGGDPSALRLVSTTDDPTLSVSEDIDLAPPPSLRETLAGAFRGSRLFGLAVLAIILIAFTVWPGAASGAARLPVLEGGPQTRLPQFRISTLTTLPWFLLLAVAAGLIAVVVTQAEYAKSQAAIDVDMQVVRGEQVELYPNDPSSVEPLRQTVVPNQRHTYHFSRPPSRVTMLRLDPTAAAGVRVVIYGIRVRVGDRTVQRFGPAELRGWQRSGLAVAADGASGLVLDTTGTDPRLWSPVLIDLPSPDTLLVKAGTVLNGPDSVVLLAMGSFLLVALCGAVRADGRREAALLVILGASAYPLLTKVLYIHGSPPPVRAAVGMTAYMGYPKSGDFVNSYVLFALSSVLAMVCWKWFSPRSPAEAEEEPREKERSWAWAGHLLVLLVLALYFMPNLSHMLDGLKNVRFGAFGWDEANGFIWNYLVEAGSRPFRDFWYPYGGFYAQLLPFPTGPLFGAAFLAFPLWFLYLGLYYVTGRRFLQSLCGFALVLIPVLMGQMPASSRYLLAADVGLLYLAAASSKRFGRVQIVFGTCVAFAVFCEPIQVIYAAAGIAVDLVAVACSRFASLRSLYRKMLPAVKQRAVSAGIPLLVGILPPLIFYATQGMLPGLWAFEASIEDQAAYGSFPATVPDWVQPIFAPNTIFLFLFLLIAYAMHRFLRRIRNAGTLTVALLVVCAIGLLCMQKQILRPHGMDQIRIYPYIAFVLYGLIMWRERARVSRPAIALFAGAVIAVSWSSSLIPAFYRKTVVAAAPVMAGNVDVLLNRRAEAREVRSTHYARSRFAAFDQQNAVVDAIGKATQPGTGERVYVLGDDSVFYILLKQTPPYLTNGYNMSPVSEQLRTLKWLERVRPHFVIWSPANASYDNTPNVVRLPLVFGYVIRNYTFLSKAGEYHILTRLVLGHLPDLAYWSSTLGMSEDLGHIPALAKLSDFGPCEKDPCQSVVVVKPAETGGPTIGKSAIRIQSEAGNFEVLFNLSPEALQYVIPTRRLWFSAWTGPTPSRITGTDERLQVSIERRAATSTVLY